MRRSLGRERVRDVEAIREAEIWVVADTREIESRVVGAIGR